MSYKINEYQSLEKNIFQYNRKCLLNTLVSKVLWGFFYLTVLGGVLLIFEYFLYLTPLVKTSSLILILIALSFYLFFYIFYPGLQLFRLIKGKSISSLVLDISNKIPEIKDRLINAIQLNDQYKTSSSSLLHASIIQKSQGLNHFSFESSIKIKQNFYKSKWRFGPILLLVLLGLVFPAFIKESSSRLLDYKNTYLPPAPFKFIIKNPVDEILEHEDLEIYIDIEGDEIPRSPEIVLNGLTYKLNSVGHSSFNFKIRNVLKNITFFFQAQNHKSKNYYISMLPKPSIQDIEIKCIYPDYLKIESKSYADLQDLTIYEGTNVSWRFRTKSTESVELAFNDTLIVLNKDDDVYYGNMLFFKSKRYALVSKNAFTLNEKDSAFFNIHVKPDLYPKIIVNSKKDSLSPSQVLFMGKVEDDHGLRNLSFWYSPERKGPFKRKILNLSSKNTVQDFLYFTDIDSLKLDKIYYFFSVTDNDVLNGFKTTKTIVYEFNVPDKNVLDELKKAQSEELKKQMASLRMKSDEKLKELEKFKNKLQQKKELGWQEKKQIKELIKEQEMLLKQINKLKEEQKKRLNSPLFNESLSNELLDKQKKLQELFDELIPEDLKKLMEELKNEMEELTKDKSMEMLEKMSVSNEELNDELDRMMELFKQFEFEIKMDEIINDLDKLKKEQLKESLDTKNKNNSLDEQKEKQNALNEKFNEIRDDFNEMERLNNELENKNQIINTDSAENNIEKSMKEASESMEKGKRNKGSDSQKNAGDKMNELQEMVEDMKEQIMEENISVDMAMLERLLDNLITISFDQEEMIDLSDGINPKGNKYKTYIQEQFKISEDIEIIEDSLHALSKRAIQLESFIMKELGIVKKNLKKSILNLTNRRLSQAKVNQQYSMTSLNNLALMLSESLEQMQSQMASGMKGCQNCQKKKGNKSGPKSLGEMQKQLGDQLKKLKERKEKGEGDNGHKQWNKSLAQMAIKQAKIREHLKALNQSKNKDGEKKYGDLEKIMEEMEQNVKDIVNNNLTEELLKRHKEITTRLLSVEKAIREQDVSEERKAESATNYIQNKPGLFDEYLKIKQEQIELYQSVPAELKPFYKKLVNKYFKQLNN